MGDDLKVLFAEMARIREDLDKAKCDTSVQPVIVTIESRFVELQSKVMNYVKALNEKVDSLAEQVDAMDAYSRRNSLLVHGLPESEQEDCLKMVTELLRDKEIANISNEQVDRVHRVGPPKVNQKHPRPVVVKFCSYVQRHEVFANKRKLKSSGISITEQLTAARMGLLKMAKDRFGVRNVWSMDGTLIVLQGQRKFKFTTLKGLSSIRSTDTGTATDSAPDDFHVNKRSRNTSK